jgi:DNA polymerase-3 subunit alpha
MERLQHEKESLGFYFSGHPFERRGRFFARLAGFTSRDLRKREDGSEVRVAGMITGVRPMVVKSGRNAGRKMARFTLEDLDGAVQVVVFARIYEDVRDRIVEDSIVIVSGRLERSGEECGIRCDCIEAAESVVVREVDSLVVRLEADRVQERLLDSIATITERSGGRQRLLLEVDEGDARFRIRADARFSIEVGDDLIDELADVVGPENLMFTRR